jgi:HSP20 family molecular chaperone IbpA
MVSSVFQVFQRAVTTTRRLAALSASKNIASKTIAPKTRRIRVLQASYSRERRPSRCFGNRRFGNYGLTPLNHVEICETPTALVLTAQIPPIPLDQIQVQLTTKTLQIAGEVWERVAIAGYCDLTYPSHQFASRFRLPQKVQFEGFSFTTIGRQLIVTMVKHRPTPAFSIALMAVSR